MVITAIRRFKLQSTPCNRLVAAPVMRRNVDEQGLHAGSIIGMNLSRETANDSRLPDVEFEKKANGERQGLDLLGIVIV